VDVDVHEAGHEDQVAEVIHVRIAEGSVVGLYGRDDTVFDQDRPRRDNPISEYPAATEDQTFRIL
jgi:hypothetical protein